MSLSRFSYRPPMGSPDWTCLSYAHLMKSTRNPTGYSANHRQWGFPSHHMPRSLHADVNLTVLSICISISYPISRKPCPYAHKNDNMIDISRWNTQTIFQRFVSCKQKIYHFFRAKFSELNVFFSYFIYKFHVFMLREYIIVQKDVPWRIFNNLLMLHSIEMLI